jgi:hypothetical protein
MQEMRATVRFGWVRRNWEMLATVLAVISLIDLSSQLIKWATLIHWLVERYGFVRNWLFGWLPFRVPPEWRNYIVLFLVLFSVTNVGFYKRMGRTYVKQLFLMVFHNAEPPFEENTLEERIVSYVSTGILCISFAMLFFAGVVDVFWGELPGTLDR